MPNTSLQNAKNEKNDEFYTRLEDVKAELSQYLPYFKDKIIYLPCDDTNSAFWKYFKNNFNIIQPKKIIATLKELPYGIINMCADNRDYISTMDDDGDFLTSEHCQRIIEECDIIITNPPFSIFRPFLTKILQNNKQFLIIGNQNAFGYKEVFPYLKDGSIWTGYNMVKEFYQPDGTTKKFGNICWFTNLPTTKHNTPLELKKEYDPQVYPMYDNYKAINVDKAINIPKDYNGVMGVPITFLNKIDLTQFRIIGISASWDETSEMKQIKTSPTKRHGAFVHGKEKYKRLFIVRIN